MPRRNRRSGPKASGDALSDVAKAAREERTQVFERTMMCKFHILGNCQKGEECHFAHERVELNALPDLFRTKLCKTLISTGKCEDRSCRYAHNKDELRTTGLKKTKMCRHWLQGNCEFGDRCGYAHSEVDETAEAQAMLQQVAQARVGKSAMPLGMLAAQSANQMQAMQLAVLQMASSAVMQAAVVQIVQAQSAQSGTFGSQGYGYPANMTAQMAAAGIVPGPGKVSGFQPEPRGEHGIGPGVHFSDGHSGGDCRGARQVRGQPSEPYSSFRSAGHSNQISAGGICAPSGDTGGGGKGGGHGRGKGGHGRGHANQKGSSKTNRMQQASRQQHQLNDNSVFMGHSPTSSRGLEDALGAGGRAAAFLGSRPASSQAASQSANLIVKNTFIDLPPHGPRSQLRSINSAAGRLDALADDNISVKGQPISPKHMVLLEQSLPSPQSYQQTESHHHSDASMPSQFKSHFLPAPAHIPTESLRSIGSSGSLTALADESPKTLPRSPNVSAALPSAGFSSGVHDAEEIGGRAGNAVPGYVVKNTFLEDVSAPPACALRTVRTAGGRLDALDEESDDDTMPSNAAGGPLCILSSDSVSASFLTGTIPGHRGHPRLVNPDRQGGNNASGHSVQEAEVAAGPSPSRLLADSRQMLSDSQGLGLAALQGGAQISPLSSAMGSRGGGCNGEIAAPENERFAGEVASGGLGAPSGMHVKNTFLDFGPEPVQGGLRAVQTFAGRLDIHDTDD